VEVGQFGQYLHKSRLTREERTNGIDRGSDYMRALFPIILLWSVQLVHS
jgi:hypothetical protein